MENLPLLTDVDFCCNPVQNRKHYRLQVLFHIPQLRQLDGVEVSPQEKIKAENLHGLDVADRELIFQSLLPEEKFVDRRVALIENVPLESDSEPEQISFIEQRNYEHAGSQQERSSSHGLHKMTMSGTQSVASRMSQANAGHAAYSPRSSVQANVHFARQYVGDLMQRVNFE